MASAPATAAAHEHQPNANHEIPWWEEDWAQLFCLGRRRQPPLLDGNKNMLKGVWLHLPMQLPVETVRKIRALGASLSPGLAGVSYVIVPCGLSERDVRNNNALRRVLWQCLADEIVVLDTTWIDEVARLPEGACWLAMLNDPYVPPVMALLDPEPPVAAAAQPPSGAAPPPSARASISASLGETWAFLRERHPDQLEADQLAKAISNSLLDFAIQLHVDRGAPPLLDDPWRVLHVPRGATTAEVRQAYRRLALKQHPDRGGSPGAFFLLQRAYRQLTAGAQAGGVGGGGGGADGGCGDDCGEASSAAPSASASLVAGGEGILALPTGHGGGDSEGTALREHSALVETWFERAGSERLADAVAALRHTQEALGLRVADMGATNRNERGEQMYNQCFYLSLARAFLKEDHDHHRHHAKREEQRGAGDEEPHPEDGSEGGATGEGGEPARHLVEETALHFKRVVEAAVLRAHPEWAGTQVGEDLQAFSDFLFFVISGSNAMLSELAIAVFDDTSGGVEVYRGVHYPDAQTSAPAARANDEQQRANLLCLRYLPGHYQSLVPAPEAHRSGSGPTLAELLSCLDVCGVRYVVTDG